MQLVQLETDIGYTGFCPTLFPTWPGPSSRLIMVVVVVEDLLFLSKIQQTARMLGIAIEVVDLNEAEERARTSPTSAVILDLNHRAGGAIELVRALKAHSATQGIPITGFLSHVQEDLAAAARAAGCDRVLARSTMAREMPGLLKAMERAQPTGTKGV
jgi:CheY-like chemotaxis protein